MRSDLPPAVAIHDEWLRQLWLMAESTIDLVPVGLTVRTAGSVALLTGMRVGVTDVALARRFLNEVYEAIQDTTPDVDVEPTEQKSAEAFLRALQEAWDATAH